MDEPPAVGVVGSQFLALLGEGQCPLLLHMLHTKSIDLIPFSLQLKEQQPDFFPLLQALVLETEEDETAKQLDQLKAMVQDVLVRFRAEVSR